MGQCGLLGQTRPAKTLNHQLRVRLPTPGDPSRYCKLGIEFNQARRRLAGVSIPSEVSEGRRETTVSRRKGGVVALGSLPCDDGLVKASKLDEGHRHPGERELQP